MHLGYLGTETCALDVAAEGGVSCARIAEATGEHEDSIESVERRALAKLRVLLERNEE